MSRVKDERGFTVVELAVSAFIALIVFGATLTVLASASTQQRLNEQTNDAQQNVRITLDRMARQLRNLASPNVLTTVGSTLPRSVDRTISSSGTSPPAITMLAGASPYSLGNGNPWPVGAAPSRAAAWRL